MGIIFRASKGFPNSKDNRDVSSKLTNEIRVLVSPANYAGQGYLWAKSLNDDRRIGARNLSLDSTFAFKTDAKVSQRVYFNSPVWSRKQLKSTREFTHLLLEASLPPFGGLKGGDLRKQLLLIKDSTDVAFVCHGTDVRSYVSPLMPSAMQSRQASKAERNRKLLREFGRPIFVSTPDLLLDLPEAFWLPNVVEVNKWQFSGHNNNLSKTPLRVLHVPSSSYTKGSSLIYPHLLELEQKGIILFVNGSKIKHEAMPELVASVDVVLDQFVLGSYGVLACEAMAAGKVVVSHVSDFVREQVVIHTGLKLPIVEAIPETISSVLTELATNAEKRYSISIESHNFIEKVHSGLFSSSILKSKWIDV